MHKTGNKISCFFRMLWNMVIKVISNVSDRHYRFRLMILIFGEESKELSIYGPSFCIRRLRAVMRKNEKPPLLLIKTFIINAWSCSENCILLLNPLPQKFAFALVFPCPPITVWLPIINFMVPGLLFPRFHPENKVFPLSYNWRLFWKNLNIPNGLRKSSYKSTV